MIKRMRAALMLAAMVLLMIAPMSASLLAAGCWDCYGEMRDRDIAAGRDFISCMESGGWFCQARYDYEIAMSTGQYGICQGENAVCYLNSAIVVRRDEIA